MTNRVQVLFNVMDEVANELFKKTPLVGPTFGFHKFQDELGDYSYERTESLRKLVTKSLETVAQVSDTELSPSECIKRDNLLNALQMTLNELRDETYFLPEDHMAGMLSLLSNIGQLVSITSVQAAQDYKSRLEKFPVVFDQIKTAFKAGIEAKVTLPIQSIERLVGMVKGLIVEDPTLSALNLSHHLKDLGLPIKYFHATIMEVVMPVLIDFCEFIENDYKPYARNSDGISSFPNAKEFYSARIFTCTSVKMTPEEVHEIGIAEVARIENLMEDTKTKIGFDGSIQDFFAALKDPIKYPQLYLSNDDDITAEYRRILNDVEKLLPGLFGKFPKTPFEIGAVPASQEGAAPMAFYMPGHSGLPGKFMLNLGLCRSSPMHQKVALALHEAVPGHHFQVSIANELESAHVYEKISMVTSYVEGWGLYAEYLGEEMGLYQDPLLYFGRLELEMFRAARLVIDSGLHSLGWSRQQAIDYLTSKVSLSMNTVESEIDRYMIMPGQALAYKIGELKIKELRRNAEMTLGKHFNLRCFHDTILESGNMSLSALENLVDRWINTEFEKAAEKTGEKIGALKMLAIMDAAVDSMFKFQPFYGPMFDFHKYNDMVPDLSYEAFCSTRKVFKESIAKIEAISALDLCENDLMKREILIESLKLTLHDFNDLAYLIPSSHMDGIIPTFGRLKHLVPIKSTTDAENWKIRLSKFPKMLDQIIMGYKAGIEKKVTLPAQSIERLIGLLQGMIVEDPAKSPFNIDDTLGDLGLPLDYYHVLIMDTVQPALQSLVYFLVNDYQKHARISDGISCFPDSAAIYKDAIFSKTSVALTPEEVHALGIQEVARIENLMNKTIEKIGFKGTLKEFLIALQDRKQFPNLYLDGDKEIIAEYRRVLDDVEKVVSQYFCRIPKNRVEIDKVSEKEQGSAPLAFYMPGHSGLPGKFMLNLGLSRASPMHVKVALALHEAIPGHHFQLALAAENENTHTFEKTAFFTSYIEGWGLYAEYLGEEMGLYQDPLLYFGRLELEMFRAVRLVVDTGLHSLGWSRQQAIDYLTSKIAMSTEELESEVDRYMVLPGQALAYKIGELKIKELRRNAEIELGSLFDVRNFHDTILNQGAMSLGALEKKVDFWVKATKAAAPAYDILNAKSYRINVFPNRHGFRAVSSLSFYLNENSSSLQLANLGLKFQKASVTISKSRIDLLSNEHWVPALETGLTSQEAVETFIDHTNDVVIFEFKEPIPAGTLALLHMEYSSAKQFKNSASLPDIVPCGKLIDSSGEVCVSVLSPVEENEAAALEIGDYKFNQTTFQYPKGPLDLFKLDLCEQIAHV